MATLAPGGRITTAVTEDEITRLRKIWATPEAERSEGLVERFLTLTESRSSIAPSIWKLTFVVGPKSHSSPARENEP
jgi:hypothetical protein